MQAILPITPAGATSINELLTVVNKNGHWTYYLSLWPIYEHAEADQQTFRLICALLMNSGSCRQCELIKAFGVPRRRLNRALKQLRERGMESFFKQEKKRRGGYKLTPEKLAQAQDLLNQGLSRSEVAELTGVNKSTISKTINAKRLFEIPKTDILSSFLHINLIIR